MYISKNLQFLRKREKITQEDLAEKLNVSRQSVSKWETGEAYPETDKLLALCDLFDVSLDGLMRTDLTDGAAVDNNTNDNNIINNDTDSNSQNTSAAEGGVKATDYAVYEKHINKFSRGIAIGALLIIFGVAVCVALSGYSFILNGTAGEITSIMGGVSVISFTAVSVFLFVLFGQRNESFKKAHPIVAEPIKSTEIKGFAVKMAALASGILVDVVYLIVMTSLIGTNIIKTVNEDMATCYVTASFLAVLAFIIGGLVYLGIQHNKIAVGEYNKQTERQRHPTQRDKVVGAVCGAVMLTATAIFMLLGFIGNYWHPAWVAFPVGGIICGIINLILNAKK
ncbi:MAG: helix-turn-helix domain-containing protein [Clostridiales bacterium]|nr:helix-turn-helix domain-containing protein [Clostridiales bacterium]